MNIAMCKRKKAYPIMSMAERDLTRMTRDIKEDFVIYECEHCNKLHIGHKKSKVVELSNEDLQSDYVDVGDCCLINIKAENSFYIIKTSQKYINAPLPEIIEAGELVAYKDGTEPYFAKGGVKAKQFYIFINMQYRHLYSHVFGNENIFAECQNALDAKREAMETFDHILLYQNYEAVAAPNPVQVQHVATPAILPDSTKISKLSDAKAETLLEKLFRLSADTKVSDGFFRGYVRGLFEASLSS